MSAPLALTMGEPSGIGGEIALKAWLGRHEGLPEFFLIDDVDRLRSLSRALGWPVPITEISAPQEASACFENALPVLPLAHDHLAAKIGGADSCARPNPFNGSGFFRSELGERVIATPGQPDPSNAAAVLGAIRLAVELVQTGQASAIVTNPIHKSVLAAAGFKHPGHTEYLAELAGGATPVMMLTAGGLRVVPVTIHIPLSSVAKRLTVDSIVGQGRILAQSLVRDFAIKAPRIAVAGVNPHAGEDGLLGSEEIEIVSPAIKALQAEGIGAFGPLPADTLFHAEARATYDAVLCMYHDQALIPVKMLGFWEGVNVTLGLPFVRTSPDHGTALALAGTGKADPGSLMAALRLAARMADSRAAAA